MVSRPLAEDDSPFSIDMPERPGGTSLGCMEVKSLQLNHSIGSEADVSKISIFEPSARLHTSTPNLTTGAARSTSRGRGESARLSIVAPRCRICYEEESDAFSHLISACRCRGTVGLLHKSCLEHWLQVSQTINCEICGYSYNLRAKPALPGESNTAKTSASFAIEQVDFLREWLHSPPVRRNLLTDCLCLALLTPITCVGVYFCITTGIHFLRAKASFQWQAPTLLGLAVILGLMYLLWILLVAGHHLRSYLFHRRDREDRIREVCFRRQWRFSVHPRPSGSSFALQLPYASIRGKGEEENFENGDDVGAETGGESSSVVVPSTHLRSVVGDADDVEIDEGQLAKGVNRSVDTMWQ